MSRARRYDDLRRIAAESMQVIEQGFYENEQGRQRLPEYNYGEVLCITPGKAEEIRQAILTDIDRGVTMLHGEGGYLHKQTEIILSVVSNHELPKIEQLARSIDPDCFMIVSSVTEVWGRGFSLGKHYQEPSAK